MRINLTPVRNINFGYNKELSRKLEETLTENPRTSIGQALLSINESCNDVEKEIIFLESNQGGVERNHILINELVQYLVDSKEFLSKMVEKLFPELNYSDIESQTYLNEQNLIEDQNKEIMKSIHKETTRVPMGSMEKSVQAAYKWRAVMSDVLDLNADDPEKDDNLSDDEFIDEVQEEIQSMGHSKASFNADNLVIKFEPTASCPKSLEDICGLSKTIEDLKDLIIFPIEHPKEAKQRQKDYGIEIPHFVLLYGPPGCGKTMLTEAIASQTGCELYELKISKVGSEFINKTSTNIQKAFDFVKEKAKKSEKPVLLFLDELDSILTARGKDSQNQEAIKDVNTILENINKLKDTNVIVIGATNMPDLLDEAGRSRVNYSSYVGLPNDSEMAQLVSKYLKKFKKSAALAEDEEAIKEIALKLKGYSPRTVLNILSSANKIAYKKGQETTKEDIFQVIVEGDWEKIDERKYSIKGMKKQKIGF